MSGILSTYACKPCWTEGICVEIGIKANKQISFARNMYNLTCPRCEYTAPCAGTIWDEKHQRDKGAINFWIPTYIPGLMKKALTMLKEVYKRAEIPQDDQYLTLRITENDADVRQLIEDGNRGSNV